jgi:glucose-1-phosphate cytidylyltransferase
MSDVTFDFADNEMIVHERNAEPWKVTLVDTGEHTQTGGRLKRIKKYLDDDIFCFTYGDGVSNVDIDKLIRFHRKQNTLATVTAVQPVGRFGELNVLNDKIIRFEEKPKSNDSWINGGYFVLSPKVLDYIEGDFTIWEREPIEKLAKEGQLSAYKHSGFWKPMDTLRDKNVLEDLWQSEKAPWKIW